MNFVVSVCENLISLSLIVTESRQQVDCTFCLSFGLFVTSHQMYNGVVWTVLLGNCWGFLRLFCISFNRFFTILSDEICLFFGKMLNCLWSWDFLRKVSYRSDFSRICREHCNKQQFCAIVWRGISMILNAFATELLRAHKKIKQIWMRKVTRKFARILILCNCRLPSTSKLN